MNSCFQRFSTLGVHCNDYPQWKKKEEERKGASSVDGGQVPFINHTNELFNSDVTESAIKWLSENVASGPHFRDRNSLYRHLSIPDREVGRITYEKLGVDRNIENEIFVNEGWLSQGLNRMRALLCKQLLTFNRSLAGDYFKFVNDEFTNEDISRDSTDRGNIIITKTESGRKRQVTIEDEGSASGQGSGRPQGPQGAKRSNTSNITTLKDPDIPTPPEDSSLARIMDPRDKWRLRNNRRSLLDIDASEVCVHLVSEEIFSCDDWERIQNEVTRSCLKMIYCTVQCACREQTKFKEHDSCMMKTTQGDRHQDSFIEQSREPSTSASLPEISGISTSTQTKKETLKRHGTEFSQFTSETPVFEKRRKVDSTEQEETQSFQQGKSQDGTVDLMTDLHKEQFIDEHGGTLFLHEADVSLHVPAGALTNGCMVHVILPSNPRDFCPGPEVHPRTTPLIICEPDSLQFNLPVKLTLPHCAVLKNSRNHTVEVKFGQKADQTAKEMTWVSETVKYSLSQHYCIVYLNHFSGVDVIIGSVEEKILRIIPYTKIGHTSKQVLTLTVWHCNDLESDFQNVIQNEEENEGLPLDSYDTLRLRCVSGMESKIKVCVEVLEGSSWCPDKDETVELSFTKKKHIIPILFEKMDLSNLKKQNGVTSPMALALAPLLYINMYDKSKEKSEFQKLITTLQKQLLKLRGNVGRPNTGQKSGTLNSNIALKIIRKEENGYPKPNPDTGTWFRGKFTAANESNWFFVTIWGDQGKEKMSLFKKGHCVILKSVSLQGNEISFGQSSKVETHGTPIKVGEDVLDNIEKHEKKSYQTLEEIKKSGNPSKTKLRVCEVIGECQAITKKDGTKTVLRNLIVEEKSKKNPGQVPLTLFGPDARRIKKGLTIVLNVWYNTTRQMFENKGNYIMKIIPKSKKGKSKKVKQARAPQSIFDQTLKKIAVNSSEVAQEETALSDVQPAQLAGKTLRRAWPSGRPNLLACLLTYFVLLPSACGTVICPENQTAELGGQGYISCNFPDDFYEVYWSDDDASDRSSPVITFKPNEEVKYGPGFESGAYDVHQNGTLIIRNVTKWYEGVYKVIVYTRSSISHGTFFISLKVTASPGNQFPIVLCHNCHWEYYYSLKDKETPSCSFNAARPPVQLEWFEYFDDGYDLVEIQQFNSSENRNGTYNSLATLHSLKDSSNMIHLLVCRATWPLSDWRREKEILVESSSNMSFSDVTPKTQYMVVNTHAVIRCGGSSSAYVVWKRILTNSEPEIIGFHSHAMTETISNIPDVEVSAEGNLIFSSPQVHHEGNYACIYGDGQKEEIQMTSVELLIPPSPPYIQITGCDDVSHSCVVKEDSTKKLTCAVYGFRPTSSLEWIAEDEDEISFFNHKEVIKESSETTDITLSVEYKVSQNVLCGEEILIGCHLYGPLSKIMKAESTALISPASCKEHGETGEHGLEGVVIALIVICATLLVVVNVIGIICLCYCIYRCRTKLIAMPMPALYIDVATDDPQDACSACTGNGKPTGNKPNGSTVHHVVDEQML